MNSPSPCIADFSVSPTTDEFATLSCYPGHIVYPPNGTTGPLSREHGLATLQVRKISTGQVGRRITLDSSSPGTLAYTPSGTSLVVFGTTIQVTAQPHSNVLRGFGRNNLGRSANRCGPLDSDYLPTASCP